VVLINAQEAQALDRAATAASTSRAAVVLAILRLELAKLAKDATVQQ
jgi:hypothetical protein